MTYIKDGVEYLDWQEHAVFKSIKRLREAGRTTNNSQISANCGLSRHVVTRATVNLQSRGFIKNVGKGAAYHWRIVGRPVAEGGEVRQGKGVVFRPLGTVEAAHRPPYFG